MPTSSLSGSEPVERIAEVVVCGGGPAGVCAAVAAAEMGADTLLVERYGFLGGMMTAGLVNPFMKYHAGDEQINAGLFQSIIDYLSEAGAYGVLPKARSAFDPELAKIVLDRMVLDAGVKLLLHTSICGAEVEGSTLRAAMLHEKGGLRPVAADVFIDATGDADLAYFAGAPFQQGRDEDGFCQPMTTNFRMAGVDEDAMPSRQEINALYDAARAEGAVENPRENVLFFYTTRPGEIHFNTTRIVKLDATDSTDLSTAELEGRRQVAQMARFLKERVPGFADAWVSAVPTQIGVRESRRIMGDYVLTAEDVLAARKFDDGIARGAYDVDIHNPAGTGTVIKHLPPGEAYDIPYRCLCPEGFDNLLVAGRPISSDHEAHSSHRVMPIAACNGEAAGVAAALCALNAADIRSVDTGQVRETLAARGASIYGLG